MSVSRRRFITGSAGTLFLATARSAMAEDYPARPVRVIVPFAPGGPVDVFGRILADNLSAHFGQQFYVENRGGAGGNIGTGRVAKAARDGYTLLLTANNHIINPILYETVPYDAVKDFEPVSLAVSFPTALSINPSISVRSVAELVAFLRANPAKYSFASPGVGTPSHLLGERFRQKLALDLVHVPYNGSGPATEAVLAGDTPIGFAGLTAAAPLVKANRLRVLATFSKARSYALPDAPTIAEAGYPGLEGEGWAGIFAPAGTPGNVISRLSEEVRRVIALPEVAERLAALGFSAIGASSGEFAKHLVEETATWREVIEAAGLKLK